MIPNEQFEYGYDPIGNRDWAKTGGDAQGLNLRLVDCQANALNQYTNISTPSYAEILGAAQANATNVSVNGDTNVGCSGSVRLRPIWALKNDLAKRGSSRRKRLKGQNAKCRRGRRRSKNYELSTMAICAWANDESGAAASGAAP